MADKNICTVEMLNSVAENTNVIVEESGSLARLNLYGELNPLKTRLDTAESNITSLNNKTEVTIVNSTVEYTCTAANTYEYTGQSITVPSGCEYNFRCYISYTNNSPVGVAVNYGTSTSLQSYRIVGSNTSGAGVCICGYTDYDITFYVWGSWSGVGTNKASIIGTIRPVS